MIEGIPKISVLIICYKQEELIKRAINSLLVQKDYIYEICVSDDCSPDKTWEVLQEYDKQYPGLFKLHQNVPNVGIFENIEYSWKMPTGDVIYQLAGDDECGKDWLKTVIEYIQNNKIDYKKELFCIYGDYKCIYPNGDSLVLHNDLVSRKKALQLALRGLISNRSACFSILVLRNFKKVSKGRSHVVEDAIDRQLQVHSVNNYYINSVGNIYYSRIGISTTIDNSVVEERKKIKSFTLQFLESEGIVFTEEDLKQFSKDNIYLVREKTNQTFFEYLIALWNTYEREYGIRSLKLKFLFFSILRRFPHNKPIEFN